MIPLSTDPSNDKLVESFRAYCWKALDNAASDAHKFLDKGAQNRLPLSMAENIPAPDHCLLPTAATFYVAGQIIPVFDYDLADALKRLSPLLQVITLRSFYLQQTDAEIAAALNRNRRTICNYKNKALRLMRKWMEED